MQKINIYQSVLYIVLTLLAIVGFSPMYRPFFSVKFLFTIVLFVFSILLFFRIKKNLVFLLFVLLLYLLYSLNFLFFKEINVLDYLTVFMCFFYVMLLLFFTQRNLISVKFFNKFFRVILIIFLIRYAYLFFTNTYHRPRLFMENNFELLFLSILLVGNIWYSKKTNILNLLMFSFIAISSESRSGIAIFFFILFTCFFKREFIKAKYLWIYTLIFLGISLAFTIFLDRMPKGGVESLDRFRFFIYFLEEIDHWSLWNYIFGSPIITALSTETCLGLSYYNELYSYKGDGSCYSVIFHSFILRVIFDHGFLGLFFLLYLIKKILTLSGFSKRYVIAMLGVLLLNSISISSLNSIFSVFGLMIVLMIKPESINTLQENVK